MLLGTFATNLRHFHDGEKKSENVTQKLGKKKFQTFGTRHALSDGLQRLVDVGVESSQRTPQRTCANRGEKEQRRRSCSRFQATSVALRNDHNRFKQAQAFVQSLFTPETQRDMHAALQQIRV
jgi:hypothetical protein